MDSIIERLNLSDLAKMGFGRERYTVIAADRVAKTINDTNACFRVISSCILLS